MTPSQSVRRPFAALLGLLWAFVSSCSACGDRRFIAELLGAQARVERDFERAQQVWSPARAGARFNMGDGLRTGPAASATLALRRGGRVLIKSDTIMRFTRSLATGDAADIEVGAGDLTVETGQVELGVHTARGRVKLSHDSVVTVHAEATTIRFDVTVGRADYDAPAPLMAAAGGGFDLVLLPVGVERATATMAAMPHSQAVVAPDAGELRDVKTSRSLRDLIFEEAPARASLTLQPGENAIIHDPAPPTDVGMLVTRCTADAVWEFDAGNGRYDALRVHGTQELRARVPLGTFRQRVRCVHDGRLEPALLGSGRLQVLRDAALRPLPNKPVSITADADGRRYTVSYQNRLPIISLRWPDAPKATQYTLHVWPEHGAMFSVRAKQPSVTLPEERLGEGRHRFAFEAQAAHSEPGLLDVSFDYRARTAYLTSPVEGQHTSSGSARFAGGTLLGSKVSAQGAPLLLDAKGRFAGAVALPAGAPGAAVRVQHPSTGVHYYVRHLASAFPQ